MIRMVLRMRIYSVKLTAVVLMYNVPKIVRTFVSERPEKKNKELMGDTSSLSPVADLARFTNWAMIISKLPPSSGMPLSISMLQP